MEVAHVLMPSGALDGAGLFGQHAVFPQAYPLRADDASGDFGQGRVAGELAKLVVLEPMIDARKEATTTLFWHVATLHIESACGHCIAHCRHVGEFLGVEERLDGTDHRMKQRRINDAA